MTSAATDRDKLPGRPVSPFEQRQSVSTVKEKPLIGWREWVVFPDFGNIRVKAKIDTGAQTSAIHAWNAEIGQRDGIDFVSFELHPLQRNNDKIVKCHAPLSDRRSVRNSGGQSTNRLFVKTHILLGEKKWPIELSLTRRDDMGFRMLLGRAAISGRYFVDPEKSFLLDK
ncbi:MAG: ATP-dependent zinc protease family protein [Hyphomicrobiaceae bacterium]